MGVCDRDWGRSDSRIWSWIRHMEIPQQTSGVPSVLGAAKTLFGYVRRMRDGLDAAMKGIAFQRG